MDTKYKIYQSKLNQSTDEPHKPLTQYHERMTAQNRPQGRSRTAERNRTRKFYQEYNNMSRQQQKEVDNSAGVLMFIFVAIVVVIAFLSGGTEGTMAALKHIAR